MKEVINMKIVEYYTKLAQENKDLKEQIEILKNERDTYKRLAESEAKQKNVYVEKNNEAKEEIEEFDYLFDIWNKRPLINKFNKEYSKKAVAEEKKKGRDIVWATPDAEYVYKKYYELKNAIDEIKRECNNKQTYVMTDFILNILKNCEEE